MKHRLLLLGLTCAWFTVSGCQRKDASEAPPSPDDDIEARTSIIKVTPNPDLLEDQSAISRRIERARLAEPVAPAVDANAQAEPNEPNEPNALGEPNEPNEPNVPTEPDEPGQPEVSDEGETESTSAKSGQNTNKPKARSTIRRITRPLEGIVE